MALQAQAQAQTQAKAVKSQAQAQIQEQETHAPGQVQVPAAAQAVAQVEQTQTQIKAAESKAAAAKDTSRRDKWRRLQAAERAQQADKSTAKAAATISRFDQQAAEDRLREVKQRHDREEQKYKADLASANNWLKQRAASQKTSKKKKKK